MRPASGAECTASGVPRETFRRGPGFHPDLLAPTRPISPARNTRLVSTSVTPLATSSQMRGAAARGGAAGSTGGPCACGSTRWVLLRQPPGPALSVVHNPDGYKSPCCLLRVAVPPFPLPSLQLGGTIRPLRGPSAGVTGARGRAAPGPGRIVTAAGLTPPPQPAHGVAAGGVLLPSNLSATRRIHRQPRPGAGPGREAARLLAPACGDVEAVLTPPLEGQITRLDPRLRAVGRSSGTPSRLSCHQVV